LYNSTDPDAAIDVFDTTVTGDKKDQLINNVGYETVDLTNFTMTPIGGKEIKKYIFTLFKVQAEMNKMMGVSGKHENDPMFFVDHAKQRVPGGGSVHRFSSSMLIALTTPEWTMSSVLACLMT
jgi:hypothetical protein